MRMGEGRQRRGEGHRGEIQSEIREREEGRGEARGERKGGQRREKKERRGEARGEYKCGRKTEQGFEKEIEWKRKGGGRKGYERGEAEGLER